MAGKQLFEKKQTQLEVQKKERKKTRFSVRDDVQQETQAGPSVLLGRPSKLALGAANGATFSLCDTLQLTDEEGLNQDWIISEPNNPLVLHHTAAGPWACVCLLCFILYFSLWLGRANLEQEGLHQVK
jgi:hypothetical protein